MALIGTLVGPAVRLATDGRGLPILASDEPEVPEGFKAVMTYEQQGGSIYQVWSVVPDGVRDDAVRLLESDGGVRLPARSAETLDDEDALKVPQLIRPWYVGEASYAAGARVAYGGDLYKCLQTHAPRIGSEPDTAPELWERINH